MRIRKAIPEDAAAFVAVKEQLPLTQSDGSTSKGGFLLGTGEAEYRDYITSSWCMVAERANSVVGFGIILPDAVLRASDVWLRRHTADWRIELPVYERQTLCYFEQFAFIRGHRRAAIALAYHLAKGAFDAGSETLFTTTVRKPVLNLAAVPFVMAAGGSLAGNIDETYPVVGPILSDIYVVHAEAFRRRAAIHPLYPFFEASASLLA